jgi:hypothetical protein
MTPPSPGLGSEDSPTTRNPAAANVSRWAALASGGFLTEARNVVLLEPPGIGETLSLRQMDDQVDRQSRERSEGPA